MISDRSIGRLHRKGAHSTRSCVARGRLRCSGMPNPWAGRFGISLWAPTLPRSLAALWGAVSFILRRFAGVSVAQAEWESAPEILSELGPLQV